MRAAAMEGIDLWRKSEQALPIRIAFAPLRFPVNGRAFCQTGAGKVKASAKLNKYFKKSYYTCRSGCPSFDV